MSEIQAIGLVREGKFFPVDKEGSVGVNSTGFVEAVKTEPLDLSEHEGKVIMITGEDAHGEIYRARIEDVANPILSAIVMKVFNKTNS